jgi:hypothetical protein
MTDAANEKSNSNIQPVPSSASLRSISNERAKPASINFPKANTIAVPEKSLTNYGRSPSKESKTPKGVAPSEPSLEEWTNNVIKSTLQCRLVCI